MPEPKLVDYMEINEEPNLNVSLSTNLEKRTFDGFTSVFKKQL